MPLCFAQDDADGSEFKKDDFLGKLDLTVPDNALFTLMGSSPETVIKPKVGDSFSATLLPQALNALGEEETSLGVEINPGLLSMPDRYKFSDFGKETKEGRRLSTAANLSRFKLSLAATRSNGDTDVTRFGAGIHYTWAQGSPFNSSIQRRYSECLRAEIGEGSPDVARDYIRTKIDSLILEKKRARPNAPEIDLEREASTEVAAGLQTDKAYQALVKAQTEQGTKCSTKIEGTEWNRNVYGVGLAVIHTQTDSPDMEQSSTGDAMTAIANMVMEDQKDLDETGAALWASASHGLGKNGQITATIQYSENFARQREENGQKINETYDGWRVGARYTYLLAAEESDVTSVRAVRGFVEAAYGEEEFGMIDDQFTQAGIGLEIQLQKNLYVQAIVGDTFDSEIDRSTYLTGQVKWSFSTTPSS